MRTGSLITGGRIEPEDFDNWTWAVMTPRGGNWPTRAHLYRLRDDLFRAACGKHIICTSETLSFYPGNWTRCAHCQRVYDRHWN